VTKEELTRATPAEIERKQGEINRRFAAEVYEHQLEKARAERNLAVAALRLYRHALFAAVGVLDVGDTGFKAPEALVEAVRVQVSNALGAADGILKSLEKGTSDGQV
jgi:hypothetical protein